MELRIAVFTAIDGTLLDSHTFEAGENRAAIARLLDAGIPVIPVSAMTLEELEPIAKKLGLQHAMIIEAGGAIARWKDGRWNVEPCGPPAETFLDVVSEIEDRSGASLLVYSAMEDSAASELSGRSGSMLDASRHRCFSEPFVIESGDPDAIARAAAELGYAVRRGQRFLHLCRSCDEAEAFTRLRAELQCDVSIAVGGSVIDVDVLNRADVAIIVPRAVGAVDTELLARVPAARVAPSPAPYGWAIAVEDAVRTAMLSKRRRRAAS